MMIMNSEHKAMDDFTRKIQEAVDYLHMDEEARIAYMTVGMKIIEECKYAREEGREKGIDDINRLNEWLINNNRKDEMIRAITDKSLQEKLMDEYKGSLVK